MFCELNGFIEIWIFKDDFVGLCLLLFDVRGIFARQGLTGFTLIKVVCGDSR